MIARSIDPRYPHEEELAPAYRVDFWEQDGASDEWRLTEVTDIHEVIDWVNSNSSGREASICIEYSHSSGIENTTVLLRLSGPEPA
ncbi:MULTISPECIES: hypothetical protein [Micrococcaceae]|uniref:hypothetical protein n=1 Tax=Micrococcaceae TaxID=1268 RepID=UPI0011B0D2B6|nr:MULTISPECIES: hypothetical protein [unclassified Arthrobacter]